jgi:multisubunit Na+/H+ antiporter MnhE subunit
MSGSIALFVLWIAMMGELSVANSLSGVVVIALVNWLFVHDHSRYVLRPWGAARLAISVLKSLVTSSWQVVLAVLLPNAQRTATSVQDVQLKHGSAFIGSIVANAITLTPGTLSLDLQEEDLVLSVHVLGEVDEARFRANVLALEDMVAEAVRERKS